MQARGRLVLVPVFFAARFARAKEGGKDRDAGWPRHPLEGQIPGVWVTRRSLSRAVRGGPSTTGGAHMNRLRLATLALLASLGMAAGCANMGSNNCNSCNGGSSSGLFGNL